MSHPYGMINTPNLRVCFFYPPISGADGERGGRAYNEGLFQLGFRGRTPGQASSPENESLLAFGCTVEKKQIRLHIGILQSQKTTDIHWRVAMELSHTTAPLPTFNLAEICSVLTKLKGG